VEQGQQSGDYWIGLETMHQLTKDGTYKLRLDMQGRDDTWYWEEYDTFIVQDSSTNYTMDVYGLTGSTGAYGSLYYHNGYPFSTFDSDTSEETCASYWRSGWWYDACFDTCFNCNKLPPYDTFSMSTPNIFVYLQSVSMRLICKS